MSETRVTRLTHLLGRNLIYLEVISRFSLPKSVCTFFPRFLSFLHSKHFGHFELGNKLFKVALSYSKNLESLKRCSEFTEEHQCRSVLKSHFDMGILLQICCIFSELLFLRTPTEGCYLKSLLMVITKSLNVSKVVIT